MNSNESMIQDRGAERLTSGSKMQVRNPLTERKDMPGMELGHFEQDPQPALGNLWHIALAPYMVG